MAKLLSKISHPWTVQELARHGKLEKLQQKVASGVNINEPGPRSPLHRRPLHVAVKANQQETVDYLLRNGAHVNAVDDAEESALHYAARNGNVEITEMLLQFGADHTIRSKTGCLPIHVAVANGHLPVQELLRNHILGLSVTFRYWDCPDWHEFDEEGAAVLGFELGEGANFAVVHSSRAGATFIVDFVQMLQINAATWMARSVSWKVGTVGAWRMPPAQPYQGLIIDPQRMAPYHHALYGTGGAPHITMPEAAAAAEDPWGASAPLSPPSLADSRSSSFSGGGGSRRTSIAPPASGGLIEPPLIVQFLAQHPAVFQLMNGSEPEYQDVVQRFRRGMDKSLVGGSSSSQLPISPQPPRPFLITCVHQINIPPARLNAFELYRADRARERGDANEVRAWHGTGLESIDRIVVEGFVISESSRNGHLYGRGLYLSPESRAFTSAEFAPQDADGDRHVLMCRVILGALEPIPFESTQFQPSGPSFDTGVDRLVDPTRYIVWSRHVNEYVMPTHVLTFRHAS